MKHHYRLRDAFHFSWHGLEGHVYSSSDDFDRASTAKFDVTGRHGKVYNDLSDRVYLVLSGSGWFEIGNERLEIEATDVVIVPKATTYDYGGTMELFLVHTPAFDPSADRDLEGLQGR